MPTITKINRENMRQRRRDMGFRENLPTATPVQTPRPSPQPRPLGAKPRINRIETAPKEQKKLRVAAYCRVSTMMESQQTSIDNQESHYRACITANPEWVLVDVYVDTGISGTEAENRDALQRLLDDARNGKIDYILTKSISRFARNTTECLTMVRTLVANHVDICFEKERLDTRRDGSEFMLTILACFAEQESRSIAGNLKWGIRKRFERGTYKPSIAAYGYTRTGDGTLEVDPAEAEVVRRMYNDLADGKGASTIANELNAEGILTRRGKYWSYTRIRDIVANPIYIGDALYQKTYMDEHFRQRRNDGELDMFYHEGHHEPIIDRETFDAANASFSTVVLSAPAENPFAGKLYCAKCGCTMYHHASKGRGRFICTAKRKHKEPCGNTPAREDDLKAAFVTLLNKLAFSQSQAQPSCRILDEYAKRKGEQDNAADRLREIAAELSENRDEQTLLTALALAGRLTVEHRHRKQELLSREQKLLDEQQILQNRTGQADELREFVNHWQITDSVESFPAEAFQTLVERVDVQSGISAAFRFACGLTLTESLRAWR